MSKKMDAPTWAFAWTRGTPYITSIVGWHRKSVMADAVADNGIHWKRIYGRGGRVIRIHIRVAK